ncbi:MAG: DegT/DnrJ/EryC1/StrS aminotransferase family protein [Ramlibacter sp.]|nr:DegT/DnrJ/EryC1/StrS aminotransferase family protein [Ramlibacter sp.]
MNTAMTTPARGALNMPRAPVLGWTSFKDEQGGVFHSVQQVPNVVFTTSGRAALYQAILQLALPPDSVVLVPTYHCPTMVAPIVRAGMRPVFYGIDADGLPNLQAVDPDTSARARAIIVAHYFGLPRSLTDARAWCDRHGVSMIEDCAHSLFGEAGDRPVGAWGDYSTASISKFLPVSETGLLASAKAPLKPLQLTPRSFISQVKGLVDVLEIGVRHGRLHGLNTTLKHLFDLKNRRKTNKTSRSPLSGEESVGDNLMFTSDMDRVGKAPLWVCTQLARRLPTGRVVVRRRANFDHYARAFATMKGARPLFKNTTATAPYVFPLWVDDADRVYRALQAIEAPVFRWDRIWPGTPSLPGDQGPLWSRHVLQLLCHQDLSDDDVARVARTTIDLLNSPVA